LPNPVNLTGYHLTFDAEMTTAADMSQFSNAFINGDRRLYANHEQQYYVDYNTANPANPFKFANGALTITASPTPSGDQPYTSGLIQTANTFSQNQGYFEIRAQTPAAQGFWPAFWMITPQYYPEIDILEQPNNSGSDSKYWATINTPEDYSAGFNETGVNVSAGYHSYGFMWTADTIQFTFDGNYIGYAHNTPASLVTAQMYLLANLAVGDTYSWPGAPITGASASYSIDYIRAYSSDPTKAAVPMETISSPDGANTTPNLGTPAATAATQTFGTGPDQFIFQVSEDAYSGDAQFTITIDGNQIGGILTAAALHGAAKTQSFIVNGTFGTGSHSASLQFLNDAYGGTSTADRNFYVDGASYNGSTMTPGTAALFSNGSANFIKAATGTSATVIPDITVGTGAHTFLFKVSEDAYQGDAQFTITVDGAQQGGVFTTTASHGAGQTQNVIVNGAFSATAGHTARINFLNDAYGGSGAGQDRNLFVDSASFDGSSLTPASGALFSNGTLAFVKASTGSSDTLTVALAEDAFQGDAQAEISIDGKVLGQATITAPNAGTAQSVTFTGDFGGVGPHTVGVNFLNDAYGGSGAGQDRNLFVKGITFDGTLHAGATANMFSGGLQNFSI
jgi:beta-glucanase (GH16 family)